MGIHPESDPKLLHLSGASGDIDPFPDLGVNRMYAHDYGDDSPYSISYAEKLYPHYISDELVQTCLEWLQS